MRAANSEALNGDAVNVATVSGEAPKRYLLRPVPLGQEGDAADPAAVLSGTRWAVLGDAPEIGARLASYGADVVVRDREHLLTREDGRVDGVLYLVTGGAPVLPDAFPVLKAALALGPHRLLAMRAVGGDTPDTATAGLRGFFRTVAREYPSTVARTVEVVTTSAVADTLTVADALVLADALVDELCVSDLAPVVLRRPEGRFGLELVESPLGILGGTGAGPAGAGAAEAAALGLDRDAVVLLARRGTRHHRAVRRGHRRRPTGAGSNCSAGRPRRTARRTRTRPPPVPRPNCARRSPSAAGRDRRRSTRPPNSSSPSGRSPRR